MVWHASQIVSVLRAPKVLFSSLFMLVLIQYYNHAHAALKHKQWELHMSPINFISIYNLRCRRIQQTMHTLLITHHSYTSDGKRLGCQRQVKYTYVLNFGPVCDSGMDPFNEWGI